MQNPTSGSPPGLLSQSAPPTGNQWTFQSNNETTAGRGATDGQASSAQTPNISPPHIQAPTSQPPLTQTPSVQAPNIQAPVMQWPNIQAPPIQRPNFQAWQIFPPSAYPNMRYPTLPPKWMTPQVFPYRSNFWDGHPNRYFHYDPDSAFPTATYGDDFDDDGSWPTGEFDDDDDSRFADSQEKMYSRPRAHIYEHKRMYLPGSRPDGYLAPETMSHGYQNRPEGKLTYTAHSYYTSYLNVTALIYCY